MLQSQKCATDHILRFKYEPNILTFTRTEMNTAVIQAAGTKHVAIIDRCREVIPSQKS